METLRTGAATDIKGDAARRTRGAMLLTDCDVTSARPTAGASVRLAAALAAEAAATELGHVD